MFTSPVWAAHSALSVVAALDGTQLEFEFPTADDAEALLLFGVCVVTLELEFAPTGEDGEEEGGGGKVCARSNIAVRVGARHGVPPAPTHVAGTLRE